MQFSTSHVFAMAASFALATAQNAFTMATVPETIHAGNPFNLTWQATTPGDVSIWLVQGPSSDSKYVSTVAANITNSGSFDWTPSSSIASGSQYALEIVSDSNPFITNWSKQFSIDGGSSSVDNSPSNSTATTSSGSSPSTTAGSSGSKTTLASVTSSKTSFETGASTTQGPSSVPNSNSSTAARSGAQFGLSIFVLGALVLAVM